VAYASNIPEINDADEILLGTLFLKLELSF
jgi:hypothetical protein